MKINNLKKQASEAIKYTREGIELLIEIGELQEAIRSLPKSENIEQFIKEIIEKEKMAVSLIQKGSLIQRSLLKNQHEEIEKLINKLS
jgi:hypothetical protein